MGDTASMLTSALFAAALTAAAPADFNAPQWTLVDPDARVTTYLERPALFLSQGVAMMDVAFADGTIEFDVALHGHVSFAGLLFRAESVRDYELIYVRPHRSRQPDALQYTPIFDDQEAWQLYYGEGFSAAAELPLNRWVHVRVVVSGYRRGVRRSRGGAAVDCHGPEAALGSRPDRAVGTRRRRAFFKCHRDARAGRGIAFPGRRSAARRNDSAMAAEYRAYAVSVVDPLQLPHVGPPSESWETVPVEASGLVNIARHRKKVSADRDVVFARTVIHADAADRMRLAFGYSDEASIFLNGRLIFNGRSAYQSRDASFLGTLTLGGDAVYLDLRRGDNELIVGIVEWFGGWGVAARVE